MAENGVLGRVVVIIFLASISIASFMVLYLLFSGFYCAKPIATDRDHKHEDSEVDSKSNEPSHSKPKTDDPSQPKYEPILNFFKRNTIATCIIFSIICIVCAMDHISLLSNPDRESDPFLMLSLPFYFIGRIFLSLIFIGRLHFTFKGSMFEYKKCTMYSLKGAWCTMVFCAVLSIIFSIPTPIVSELFGMAVGILFVLIDIALLFILLYLYGKKLYVLMVSGDAYFLSIMTRYAWLYTVCFMSTFAVILCFVAQLASLAAHGASLFRGEDIVIFVSIDALVNSVCLWLNLRTADHWYDRLCRSGDNLCRKCCRYCTNNTKDTDIIKDIVSNSGDKQPVRKDMNVTIQSTETGNQAIIL